jgi:aminopeptidase N
MDTWTLQKGYPVVNVAIDREAAQLRLSQTWFLLNPLNKVNRAEFEAYKWYVPFTYTTNTELNFEFETKPVWLTPDKNECNKFETYLRI